MKGWTLNSLRSLSLSDYNALVDMANEEAEAMEKLRNKE